MVGEDSGAAAEPWNAIANGSVPIVEKGGGSSVAWVMGVGKVRASAKGHEPEGVPQASRAVARVARKIVRAILILVRGDSDCECDDNPELYSVNAAYDETA